MVSFGNCGSTVRWGLCVITLIVVYIVFVLPFLYKIFPNILKRSIFRPQFGVPKNVNYKHPEDFGFLGARNFYLNTSDGARLGVWHTFPVNLGERLARLELGSVENTSVTRLIEEAMVNATVIIYLHGAGGTRANPRQLYHLLNRLQYHVITFDYRGYGDSSGEPRTESDVVEDTRTVVSWVEGRVAQGHIFLWGHSLGTGVAAHAGQALSVIEGVILEAPFNNMMDEARYAAGLLSLLPWFDYCVLRPLQDADLSFQSDVHLSAVSTPVLILSAEDDDVVPHRLAVRLSETLVTSRSDPDTVRMKSYAAALGYGHFDIPLDPALNHTVQQFVLWALKQGQM